jgi:hypothetical protein
MLVKPNSTTLRGTVKAIRPEPDGWGVEIDLQIDRNESESSPTDFIRPEPGSVLRVFAAEPGGLSVGDVLRAETTLNAGPFGGRVVLRSFERVAKQSATR